MRPIHLCLGCACFYLPAPALPFSPVHCGSPECRNQVRGALARIGLPEETVACWASRAAGLDGKPRRPRPGRRPRGRRPATASGARSKLQ
ncbi:hypothetical protein [Streptomyces pactum]|uniref:hypothetical protein n=1 Tax=Streptomyces pactum TaxID=68249 RepID=UPI0018D9FC6E|nr:hypothetical protein [Streptomyces pactum]